MPNTVAARSKAWTVFAHSNTGIMGSNRTWGIDVCVSLFCVQVAALQQAEPPSKESYRLCKKIKELKNGQDARNGCKTIDR
jgi:hypothetical protein